MEGKKRREKGRNVIYDRVEGSEERRGRVEGKESGSRKMKMKRGEWKTTKVERRVEGNKRPDGEPMRVIKKGEK